MLTNSTKRPVARGSVPNQLGTALPKIHVAIAVALQVLSQLRPQTYQSCNNISNVSFAVLSVDRRRCHLSQPITLTSQSGSLASVTSQHLGLGTVECPWKIRVSPGQKITLSLRYFQPEKPDADSSPPAARTKSKMASNCYELATVRETETATTAGESRSITTCDGQQRGEHELFTTTTNEISVQIVGRMMLKNLGRFIVSYRGYIIIIIILL